MEATKRWFTFLFTREVKMLLKNVETEMMDKLLVEQCVALYTLEVHLQGSTSLALQIGCSISAVTLVASL